MAKAPAGIPFMDALRGIPPGETGLRQDEEKELTRVFNQLCGYATKRKMLNNLQTKNERLVRLRKYRARPFDSVKLTNANGKELTDDEVKSEYESMNAEVKKIKVEIASVKPGMISRADLDAALKNLGVKQNKAALENAIWEVDENLDGMIDWEECKLMCVRARARAGTGWCRREGG